MPDPSHDVFMSYNSEDREAVESIAVYLADNLGLRPWLDQWYLIPGEPWLQRLERGLASAKSCAVFVGQSGKGPWQDKEMAAALDRQVKTPEFRVIPVLLPDAPAAPQLPIFLAGNTWVQFRDMLDDHALWRLECGIRGKEPGRGRLAPAADQRFRQPEPRPYVDPASLIYPGGAVEVDSRFYITRAADEEVFHGIHRARGLVTVRGPRQTGKTSLILHAYVNARRSKRLRPVFVDFQLLPGAALASLDTIWCAIAADMATQLGLENAIDETWRANANYDRNLSRFLDRCVAGHEHTPILLCLDEVDRIFSSPLRADFFPSVRAFYNRGAYDPAWKALRWLLSTSSEPSFFIDDLTQSPFNIGLRVELTAFTHEETAEFAHRHGLSLQDAMIDRIMDYLGGRPYLVHLLLYHMALYPDAPARWFDARSAGGGVFREHLQRYLGQLQHEPALAAAMQGVIAEKGCADVTMAHRLEAAGLVRRDPQHDVVCACTLYRDYFKGAL